MLDLRRKNSPNKIEAIATLSWSVSAVCRGRKETLPWRVSTDSEERTMLKQAKPSLPDAQSGHGASSCRSERLPQKLRTARASLAGLAPESPLARLVRLAITRRDETLLDALLARIHPSRRNR